MTRTDIHRPSTLVPADYSFVLSFAFDGNDGSYGIEELNHLRRTAPFFSKENGKGGCHICGAHYRYGSVFVHNPTGEHIAVGWECADQLDHHATVGGRQEVLRGLEKARRKAKKRAALKQFVKNAAPEILKALRCKHRIVKDIRNSVIQWGNLTDKQIALVIRLAREEADKDSQPAEIKIEAPEGRVTVQGTVVSIKICEGYHGDTLKMTVKVTTGSGIYLVWSTVPSSLIGIVQRGNTVQFTATLSRSDRDKSFAFAKKPSAASIIS